MTIQWKSVDAIQAAPARITGWWKKDRDERELLSSLRMENQRALRKACQIIQGDKLSPTGNKFQIEATFPGDSELVGMRKRDPKAQGDRRARRVSFWQFADTAEQAVALLEKGLDFYSRENFRLACVKVKRLI